MRCCYVFAFLAAVGWAASGAPGQGLYGAPEMLRLGSWPSEAAVASAYLPPQAGSAGVPSGYPAYPTTDAPYAPPPPTATDLPPPQPVPTAPPGAQSGYPPTAASPGYYGGYDPAYAGRTAAAAPAAPGLAPPAGPQGGQPGPAQPATGGSLMRMKCTPLYPPALPAPPGSPQPPPSLVSQMLAEAGNGRNPSAAYGGVCGPGGQAGPCGSPMANACAFDPMWYVSAAGLIMSRDMANGVWTTYETDNNPNQLMRTTDAGADWRAGYDLKIGRRFGCDGCWAIEGEYWTIDRLAGYAEMSLLPANTVSTPLIVDEIEFAGVNGTYFFDGAAEHKLWRAGRIQSIELSLVRRFPCGPGARAAAYADWDLCVLAGVRYFNFEERLTFGTLAGGGTWGGNGGLDEAYLREYITNNLFGFQFGCEAGYRMGRQIRVFVIPKLGIYGNHIESRCDLFRGDGTQANPTAGSGVPGSYPVYGERDVFAFLAQIDVGLDWEFHPGWNAFIGYRLVAATGIGLADHQIPPYLVDLPAWSDIEHNGNLLVHGALAGLRVRF